MPTSLPRICFGADYNPEQWPAELVAEDIELMQQAGVNLVTVGVFAWALLEPEPGRYDFWWLDRVVDQLGEAGIAVDLATATASPPPWLTHLHPEVLPETKQGTKLWPGGRQGFCPSSPIYLEHALRLCTAMAQRYGAHDALALWHVNNEFGCHNVHCYCEVSAQAFRVWLRKKYGDVVTLNEAWGTTFWSQRYRDFTEIRPPRQAANFINPTMQLDFFRFSSDQLLSNFRAERDILHQVSPGVPVTTNFMVMDHQKYMDYLGWGPEQDLVSNDHYLVAADADNYRELAMCADLTRGAARGKPWILMESSTSAVNWQPRNVAKLPGELLRTSLQHVARGADGVMFFQWRASRAGSEKFHSAMLPHAGTETRIWREVTELGQALASLAELSGSVADNRAAIVFDWNCWWASELDCHPSVDLKYWDLTRRIHQALTDQAIGVDFVVPDADLSGYDLIVVPTLYLVTDVAAQNICAAAERGATVLVTYFSGIVDEHDHIRLGGYPGAFRELLGVWGEEFLPLREGERLTLSNGFGADVWAEDLTVVDAEVRAEFGSGPACGKPALTRRQVGPGAAWYLATRLDQAGVSELINELVREANLTPVVEPVAGVEAVCRRDSAGRSWTFLLNHSVDTAKVRISGFEILSQAHVGTEITLASGGVAVVRNN